MAENTKHDMTELKERERNILIFMKNYRVENGYPPTVREICEGLNIKSTSTVHKDLSTLAKLGYIAKGKTKSRALNVDSEELESATDPSTQTDINISKNRLSSDSINTFPNQNTVNIPVLGNIAAGKPIFANGTSEDEIPIPSRFLSNKNHFLLKVKGESMIEAGIMNGDYILAEEQNTAENGDMVIAMLQDGFEAEATVKTFYKEKDHIRLQPENSSMKPILTNDVQILGKVKGVFRYFN